MLNVGELSVAKGGYMRIVTEHLCQSCQASEKFFVCFRRVSITPSGVSLRPSDAAVFADKGRAGKILGADINTPAVCKRSSILPDLSGYCCRVHIHNVGNTVCMRPARGVNVSAGRINGTGYCGKRADKITVLIVLRFIKRTPPYDRRVIEIALNSFAPFRNKPAECLRTSNVKSPVSVLAPDDVAASVAFGEKFRLNKIFWATTSP